ncbi:hypothetical protein [Sansalvadorimonas verongulae]|uniref:hypothetical protein n=1 Tax=Sansalvadorimonas verongulae TaxID=2172824 RepID=UPI0012BC474D|nr:hypothetical protein [Sansalvadorimonas verongulae]MTI13817.1 hypothetical protein [Sansalvadorimonas verongulae]
MNNHWIPTHKALPEAEDSSLENCPFCGTPPRWDMPSITYCENGECPINEIEIDRETWNNRAPTKRAAPCEHYCEQHAFNAEIRKLKAQLTESSKRLESDEGAALAAAAPAMLEALKQARDDLIMRADVRGEDTVQLGFTAWYDLNEAIEAAEDTTPNECDNNRKEQV